MKRRIATIILGVILLSTLFFSNGCNINQKERLITKLGTTEMNGHKIQNQLGWFVVSPDDRHIAREYVEYVDKKNFNSFASKPSIIVDSSRGKQYASIGEIIFSPDNRRLVYVAHPDQYGQVLVENGVETKRYTWTSGTGSSNSYPTIKPLFSPDSKHLVYTVTIWDSELKSLKQAVVYDGKQGKEYDKVNNLQFSTDGKHLVYTAYMIKDKKDPRFQRWYVVIDGEEREYTGLFTSKVIFDSADTLHYVVFKGSDAYLVEEKLK